MIEDLGRVWLMLYMQYVLRKGSVEHYPFIDKKMDVPLEW